MLVFELSFPSVGSWNGQFTGQNNLYAITRNIRGKEKNEKIIKDSPYSFRWDDGWSASIKAKEVTSQEAAKIKRKSKGFLGYEWMVDSIVLHGKILTEKERGMWK